jgi:peptidoglycan/LPS O-acetylase OafA/YrhL
MPITSTLVAPVAAPTATRRVFFPNLDGLRFLAFFAVFLFHSFYTADPAIKDALLYQLPYQLTRAGHLGVNFFFVLSGFLITYLLLTEKTVNGRVAIGPFYMRRVLRIWPLYFAVVLFGFVIIPMLRARFGVHDLPETAHPAYFLLFLANFNGIYYGCQTPTLTVLWSVAVEEQFYLVWPLLIALVPIRKMGWLLGGVLVASLVFRYVHQHESLLLNLHTFGVIGDMAFGGLAAWLCFRDDKFTNALAAMPRWSIGAFYLLGIGLIYEGHVLNAIPGYVVIERLVLAFFFAFVILEQNYAQHSFIKMSRLRLVSYWGTYTYGLYCLHYFFLLVAYQILHRLGLNGTALGAVIGDNALGLALAMAASWVSFNFYEKPFLKLKDRFAFIKTH